MTFLFKMNGSIKKHMFFFLILILSRTLAGENNVNVHMNFKGMTNSNIKYYKEQTNEEKFIIYKDYIKQSNEENYKEQIIKESFIHKYY